MKELKYPEMVYNKEFDINIKPYLTMEEIDYISTEVSKQTTWGTKEIMRDGLLFKVCTDMEKEIIKDYDLCFVTCIVDVVKKELGTFYDKLLEAEKFKENFGAEIKEFLRALNEVVKEIPKERVLPYLKSISVPSKIKK